MAGADAGAVISMKVLIKQEMIAPLWILLEQLRRTEHRPLSLGIAEEETDETAGEPACDLPERGVLS